MDWENALKIAAACITLITALYGVVLFIDKRIDRKLRDDAYLRKIASVLHPIVIFDHKGSILIDQGAMRFIASIKVEPSKILPYPEHIIVSPNKHLAQAPLLTLLDADMANVKASRGTKYDWVFALDYFMTNSEREILKYRLEIIL
ncbi:MAG: hypothetical protein D4R93_06885 [Deltaproteobacteria bacterium]|nr:MAG: hypothetical protein D4R93_06885 [Deltaproteobacteria bacterium]